MENKLILGAHLPVSGGLYTAFDRAAEIGANTFQLFTGNPRSWSSSTPRAESIEAFMRAAERNPGISPVISHASYLPNIASPDDAVYARSKTLLIAETKRCNLFGIKYLVVHLGSGLGSSEREMVSRIASGINEIVLQSRDVDILLENTAGVRNSTGSSIEKLTSIFDLIDNRKRVGLCLDVQHAFAAGYDFRKNTVVEDFFHKVGDNFGSDTLKAVHLNDSRCNCGGKVDRHAAIGTGFIGEAGFLNLLANDALARVPLILETRADTQREGISAIKRIYRSLTQE